MQILTKNKLITDVFSLVCLHFRSNFFKADLKEKRQQFWNLICIILLKVYCSSFSAYTASTFDWLSDGRSLKKTVNRLINRICFRVRSITKKVKCRKYCVKVHIEKYSPWYLKTIWKIQYKFADDKINWLPGWCYSSTFIFCLIVLQTLLISVINLHSLHSRFVEKESRGNFFGGITLIWFC